DQKDRVAEERIELPGQSFGVALNFTVLCAEEVCQRLRKYGLARALFSLERKCDLGAFAGTLHGEPGPIHDIAIKPRIAVRKDRSDVFAHQRPVPTLRLNTPTAPQIEKLMTLFGVRLTAFQNHTLILSALPMS